MNQVYSVWFTLPKKTLAMNAWRPAREKQEGVTYVNPLCYKSENENLHIVIRGHFKEQSKFWDEVFNREI